jgi:signal transduction histidine kinase
MFQRNIAEGVFYGREADLRSSGTHAAKWMRAVGSKIQSRLEVPLGTEAGGAIGYLGVSSLKPEAFSLDDLGLLEKVAIQITPAIQNAIVYQRTVDLAEEKARRAALESQSREMERLNHARSQFLSTITHELKTPLTSIMAFSDILSRNRSENLTARQIEQINIVRRNATHLHGLINDLLDISKTEAGRMALSEQRIDLAALVSEVAASMQSYYASRRQTLKVETPGHEVAVLGDRDRLEQVITNLLSNAAKYSPAQTMVTVAVEGDAHWCSISVKDQGIGMSEEEQLHLFAPFYRSDNSVTRESDGVGLGLAIVKHIVDIHAGRIEVKSAPGEGSTFTVHLPTRLELGATGL